MNILRVSALLSGKQKAKRKKFGVDSLIFLVLFGAVFVSAGFFAINHSRVDSSWARTSGEVVDSLRSINEGSTYSAVVEYHVDAQSYRITSGFSSSFEPTIGETREVAYNPSQPSQAKIVESASTTWWLWIFPVIGLTVLIIAPVAFFRSVKRSKRIDNLLQTGQKLQGVLVDVQPIDSQAGTCTITVAATDSSGVVRNYTSDVITGSRGFGLLDLRSNPVPIDVYIDPTNPENYYVDIADIPGLTPERIKELIEQAKKKSSQ